uniref:RNA polymerase II-associated protein 1-like n=1 Tax=Myxine glutinosa TaxID=7769 RepID=UPI00358FA1AF
METDKECSENPEEHRHDTHITAVLSKIMERDTSGLPVTLPPVTSGAFPKVFHRSLELPQGQALPGRKSLFAQQTAARKAASLTSGDALPPFSHTVSSIVEGATTRASRALENEVQMDHSSTTEMSQMADIKGTACRGLVTGQGLGTADAMRELQSIHKENEAQLHSMGDAKIKEAQQKLLAQLDPKLVALMRSRKAPSSMNAESEKTDACLGDGNKGRKKVTFVEPSGCQIQVAHTSTMEEKPGTLIKEKHDDKAFAGLPLRPALDWLHMDKLETEKLEWLREMPQLSPRRKRTSQEMQARFNFQGSVVPPDIELPTHLGLHHHGDEPECAGYSLQELFILVRSQVTQQRVLALQILGRIISQAQAGELTEKVQGSLLRTLLDAGLLFIIRFALDDTSDAVIAAAAQSLCNLIVCPSDEEYLDKLFCWYLGSSTFPMAPMKQEFEDEDDDDNDDNDDLENENKNEETFKQHEGKKTDTDVARSDVIQGLLQTQLLQRIRYILEVLRPGPAVVLAFLQVLTRMARHSTQAASQVLDCPGLVEMLVREFLPVTWETSTKAGRDLTLAHGLPLAPAMKLMRVLSQVGRHASAIILYKLEMRTRVARFLAEDPNAMLLEPIQGQGLALEALRLWAVAASYGQLCDLFREIYPLLVKQLQKIPSLLGPSCMAEGLKDMRLCIAETLLVLLTAVTRAASWEDQLQTQMVSGSCSDESPLIPPPPISWVHVTGLGAFVQSCLHRCLQVLVQHPLSDYLWPLATTLLLYTEAYYCGKARQPSTNTIEILEELELFCNKSLFPFLESPMLQDILQRLRSCSVLCNPTSCVPGPESLHNLVTLGCNEGKPPVSFATTQSPFGLVTALLCLLRTIASQHKGLASRISGPLCASAMMSYMELAISRNLPVSHTSAWLLHHELNLLSFSVLLAAATVQLSADVARHSPLFHSVALALLGRLLGGSESIVADLISSVIFNPDFLPEGRQGGPEAADLEWGMTLAHEAKFEVPSSAAKVEVGKEHGSGLGGGNELRAAWKALPNLRKLYLLNCMPQSETLARSRALHEGRPHEIQALLLPAMSGPLLPTDWAFLPLLRLCSDDNGVKNTQSAGRDVPDSLSDTERASALSCLRWLVLLEIWRPAALSTISAAACFCRLACVFLAPGTDLFLEQPMHACMTVQLGRYSRPAFQNRLVFDEAVPGISSFPDFYAKLLVQFEAASFGDGLFSAFVLLPLQRRFPAALRHLLFAEHSGALRYLQLPLKQLTVPLERFTEPAETDLPLIRLYLHSLLSGRLRQSWSPVLYTIVLAHLNSFIFLQKHSHPEETETQTSMIRQIIALKEKTLCSHLLMFKLPNRESSLGFDLYKDLPALRQKWLHSKLGFNVTNVLSQIISS